MSNIDIYKLKDRIKSYQKGREEYLELIEIAKDNLKEYEENAQSVLLEDINQRRKEEFKLFCKSAKYLYKNRKEIIQSGKWGWIILDFLNIGCNKKIYLKDLLSDWEEGFIWIDDGDECLIIGATIDIVHNKYVITYLKDNKICNKELSSLEITDIMSNVKFIESFSKNLTDRWSDFEIYTTFSEIPARLLGIEEW